MKKLVNRCVSILAMAGLIFICPWTSQAEDDVVIETPYLMPARASMKIDTGACQNNKSMLEVSGTLIFGTVDACVRFVHPNAHEDPVKPGRNKKGPKDAGTETFQLQLDITDTLVFKKSPSVKKWGDLAGAGGNPWIWIRLNGDSEWTLLGRCRKSPYMVDADMFLNTLVRLGLNLGCDNSAEGDLSGNRYVSLGGGVDVRENLKIDLRFTNNMKATHEREDNDVDATVTILSEGTSVSVLKGGVEGVSGDPDIFLKIGGCEEDTTWEHFGRCHENR